MWSTSLSMIVDKKILRFINYYTFILLLLYGYYYYNNFYKLIHYQGVLGEDEFNVFYRKKDIVNQTVKGFYNLNNGESMGVMIYFKNKNIIRINGYDLKNENIFHSIKIFLESNGSLKGIIKKNDKNKTFFLKRSE